MGCHSTDLDPYAIVVAGPNLGFLIDLAHTIILYTPLQKGGWNTLNLLLY